MNLLTEDNQEEVFLQEKMNELYLKYDKQLLGIFIVGNRYIAIVIPTLQDLCLLNKTGIEIHTEDTDIYDIRYMDIKDLILKKYLITEKYKDIFEKCIKKKNFSTDGIVEILKVSLEENAQINEFFNNITGTEKNAFEAIKKEIGKEGNITISKIVDKTNISRPVYTNLLNKMKTYNVAEVVNQGFKGTYIKFSEKL